MSEHQHYWNYDHSVWQGRQSKKNEVGIVRFCNCGVKQMAFTDKWAKPPKSYDLDSIGINPSRKQKP